MSICIYCVYIVCIYIYIYCICICTDDAKAMVCKYAGTVVQNKTAASLELVFIAFFSAMHLQHTHRHTNFFQECPHEAVKKCSFH